MTGRQPGGHLEIEQKFDVDAEFERPDFGAARGALGRACGERVNVGAPAAHHLSATYFDTADGRLAAGKATLRRRAGGTDEGWHLKLPGGPPRPGQGPAVAGLSSRLEVHEPLDAGEAAGHHVPARLASLVADLTGGLPLAPVAALDTRRSVVALSGDDGRLLAEIADDVVTARRLPRGEPVRWREIEVEVPAPAPELQRAVAGLLYAAGARPAGYGSKLARLLGG